MKIDTTLRQWCPECGKATVSKIDADGNAYCAECPAPALSYRTEPGPCYGPGCDHVSHRPS